LALALGSVAYLSGFGGASEWMSASGELVFAKGEYWRLFTTILAHADAGHLLSNTFLFFILSYFLYGYFGARLFPAAAFFGGALANFIVLRSYDQKVVLVGASGVVYWMGGAWLILYFFLSRQKNFTQRWLRTLGVAILLFMPAEKFEPAVSYRTHFVGFAIGVVVGALFYWYHRKEFLAAEVRETIVEDADPGDDLPPPEGFPVDER
jgi:rhomboid protease GluP